MHRTIGNPTAKAAIGMALWDILGKAWGQPVHRLRGGWTDRMRVSHMLGFDDPAKMVDEAARMIDTYGIRTFRVKVGRRAVKPELVLDIQGDESGETVTYDFVLDPVQA